MPGEIGIGAPVQGLYLREDVEMRCNFLLTRFVRKVLKECLQTLVARLIKKAELQEAAATNRKLWESPSSPPMSPFSPGFPRKMKRFSTQTAMSELDGSQKSPRSPRLPVIPQENRPAEMEA